MSFVYHFAGELERIFTHLHHDQPGLTVDRAEAGGPTEGTVVLRPGDTLHTEQAQTHAELVPADAATEQATAQAWAALAEQTATETAAPAPVGATPAPARPPRAPRARKPTAKTQE
jgi:hypothetical protein